MKGDRPWYREPETFIAVAALVVSVSAVAVGLYEAQLQRAHGRAEVWPHVEISTFVTPKGASLFVENTGLGPAIIKSVVVTVDGKPRRSWDDVLRALGDSARAAMSTTTVVDHALRGGERTALVGLDRQALPDLISTFVTPKGASLFVENTGLGPAIIKSVVVTVDGKPRRSWDDVLRALGDSARAAMSTTTVVDHALRGGERTALVGLDRQAL